MKFTLTATTRTGQAAELRAAGKIPAVVYGPHIESFSVAVPYNDFEKVFGQAGESSMIELDMEGKDDVVVLVKDMQFDPVKGNITHVDFRQVTMGEEMEVTMILEFEGVAPAEKQLGGTLITSLDTVQVRCLPKDLVESITVDLSTLATFDDSISVADLKLPEGITVLNEPTALIAKVSAPLTEDQLAALEETTEASVEDVAVEEKGKAEEGSAEEGEAKAADKE